MNLQSFRQIVDFTRPGIAACEGDLHRLYDYVGLEHGPAHTRNAVSDALYARMKVCFTSGHPAVWRTCKSLRTDLIREHVLHGTPLDPYFEVLDHLQDAMRNIGDPRAEIEGDWEAAIRGALDHMEIQSFGSINREKVHARDFAVARMARGLKDAGFAIRLEPGGLRLEEESQTKLVAAIEGLVAKLGGINVARRIFKTISPQYDAEQQRYHVVRRTSTTGEGTPQVPWAYLIQLAAKHAQGREPRNFTDDGWRLLCGLSQAYAALIDVQRYAPTFWASMDAFAILPYLQETAVYDTLFRIPQMRPSDVAKMARGMFDWLDIGAPTKAGWSVAQAIEIIGHLLGPARDARGPTFIDESDIRRSCPEIPRDVVSRILDEVLSHPATGPNRDFSRPTDTGHDFFKRPLIRQPGRRFLLLDRSFCAPACLEALLTPLRAEVDELDHNIGSAIERFLQTEFSSHGVTVSGGDYDAGREHGQCDLVIETPETVIFSAVKKKALTRKAKAGSDADLLLDLAGSLLAAQAQAGWHEVRLRRDGHLDLMRDGLTEPLELRGRQVERVAVSLFDFGSFQDRILLKQFLEATLNAKFTPVATSLSERFDEINEALREIREQVAVLFSDHQGPYQPFFNCWFLSVPQLLVFLDGVTDSAGFRTALWSCRHIATGSSDVYFDLSMMKRWKREAAAMTPKPTTS